MPTHPRQLLREAIKAALLGATAAGSRVYETRLVPWRQAELPAISVYATEEEVDPASKSTAPRELTRNLSMTVEAVVSVPANGNVDDELDAISLEVERAMHADQYFGGTAADSVLASTVMGTMVEGNRPMGAVQLVYLCTYRTGAPEADDVELDSLETAVITHNPGGAVHPDNRPVDRLEDLDQ